MQDEIDLKNAILLADSNRGIYAAQYAIKSLDPENVTFDNVNHIDILTVKLGPDPDNSDYWQSWNSLLSAVIIEKKTGKKYSFYQDGGVWLIPIGKES
jgi:hypothetical protein